LQYEPSVHRVPTVMPVDAQNMPSGHGVGAERPATQNVPAGHRYWTAVGSATPSGQ
jgi:hypothetical protein